MYTILHPRIASTEGIGGWANKDAALVWDGANAIQEPGNTTFLKLKSMDGVVPIHADIVGIEVYVVHSLTADVTISDEVTDTFTGTAGTLVQSHVGELNASWASDSAAHAKITNAGRVYLANDVDPASGALLHNTYTPSTPDYTVECDFVNAGWYPTILDGGF